MGIEPTTSAWEADVLPLNYARETVIYYPIFSEKSQDPIEQNHRFKD